MMSTSFFELSFVWYNFGGNHDGKGSRELTHRSGTTWRISIKNGKPMPLKVKRMKKFSLPFALAVMVTVISSCTTLVQMERTSPPEALLPTDSSRFLFVNFFDYMIPDYIRDRHEAGYRAAVKGYAMGLSEMVQKDSRAVFMIADTLRKGHSVMSMQYPEFTDTVRAICSKYGANLLVALDSINLKVDWDVYLTENDEGGSMLAKDFYLFSDTYMTLYSADGEVIDRCAGEKNTYVKSKYTIFGMIGGPNVGNQQERIKLLSQAAARDCIGRYFPFTEQYTGKLYSGGELTKLNLLIVGGRPEEAVGPLTELSQSASASLAEKAAHNLAIANEIIENKRIAGEVWNQFHGNEK